MPELPDVTLHVEALDERIRNHVRETVSIGSLVVPSQGRLAAERGRVREWGGSD